MQHSLIKSTRPWGSWEVLSSGEYYKVKKLIILPEESISNQYHVHRSETWCIVHGSGQLTLGNKIIVLNKGDVFTIKPGEVHKVKNLSNKENLIAIEVQMGHVCSEDDIFRIENRENPDK